MAMARAVGVIPARWGSMRFPGKSLAPLLGKPLVLWVVEAARRACAAASLVVETGGAEAALAISPAAARERLDHVR